MRREDTSPPLGIWRDFSRRTSTPDESTGNKYCLRMPLRQHSAKLSIKIGAPDPYAATTDADALVLITEWHELRALDYAKLSTRMRTPTLFDGRNVWSPDEARRAGFVYHGIGRK